MPLTDIAIKNAKTDAKPLKLFDSGGLSLLVTPAGGKWWRLKYRYSGKEKLLSLGIYPDVPLAGRQDKKTGLWIEGAREKRDHARKLLACKIDPAESRRAEKAAGAVAGQNTFEVIAREWHAKQSGSWAKVTADAKLVRLEADLFPGIGKKPIRDLNAPALLKVLQAVEGRGANELARRVRQILGQIFRYAISTGRISVNPAADLAGALPPANPVHHAAITEPKAVGGLMRAIQDYQGEPVTRAALRLAPLVFVRPGELRAAEWEEFDLDEATWRIPGERMKMREAHIVPLSKQAVAVLRELSSHTGNGRFVLPSIRSRARPMSENPVNAALRRLGYTKAEMTGHGFRSMASTLLNEQGWHRDAIERQLAHAERDTIRAAYNRAEHLPERKRMMQAWADYLDKVASGAKVVPVRGNRG